MFLLSCYGSFFLCSVVVLFFLMIRRPPISTRTDPLFPYTTLFRSARHPGFDGLALSRALRAEGILVRHFTLPRIDQFLRISVGTPDECARLCNTLAEILTKTH